MKTTKLSSKGQVIIPKTFRAAHHWTSGLELVVIEMGDGVLLKPKAPFEETCLDDVAGCLNQLHRSGKDSGRHRGCNEARGKMRKLFGLSNAQLVAQAIDWHEYGLDFVDAFHLALSQHHAVMKTFDEKFVKRAKKLSECRVEKL